MKTFLSCFIILLLQVGMVSSARADTNYRSAASINCCPDQRGQPKLPGSGVQGIGPVYEIGEFSSVWSAIEGPGNKKAGFLTMDFDTPLYAACDVKSKAWANWFLCQVDMMDKKQNSNMRWHGKEIGGSGGPVEFHASWAITTYLVYGIKFYIDADNSLKSWEEKDSVKMEGGATLAPVYVSEPATIILFGFGLGLLGLSGIKGLRKGEKQIMVGQRVTVGPFSCNSPCS